MRTTSDGLAKQVGKSTLKTNGKAITSAGSGITEGSGTSALWPSARLPQKTRILFIDHIAQLVGEM
jgi:hypothetical protein